MSTDHLLKEIKSLPEADLQVLLNRFFAERKIFEEIEHLGYLKLSENSFEFWNDPREDIYQDYAKSGRT